MKKLYYGLLVAICSTLFFVSCSDDEGENKSDDVINGSIYGTWLLVREYGEDEDGPWDKDPTDSTHPYYLAFYEDGTGKDLEGGYLTSFTWTANGRNLTMIWEDHLDYSDYYIRKLTADELVLYSEYYEDNEDWERWCEVYVRVDKEL